MSKILTDKELGRIVSAAISGDAIGDSDQYAEFVKDLADVVAKHFGGIPSEFADHIDDGLGATIAIHLDENVPPDGGVYAAYDPDVKWRDGEESQ